MALSTAQDLVDSALRLIQVTDQESGATTQQRNNGLDSLNAIMDSLATANLHYRHDDEDVTVSGQSHSWGSGAEINSPRPILLRAARYVKEGKEVPINDFLPIATFRVIIPEKQTAGDPEFLSLDPQFPNARLYIYPVFNGVIKISSLKPWSQYGTLGSSLSLPPGYVRYLRHMLAIELAPEYGVPPSEVSIGVASQMMNHLHRINTEHLKVEYRAMPGRRDYFAQ